MLAEALPEAIGLQFVMEVFGKEGVQLLTEKKMEQYAKDRHNEPNQEPPLLYADGADYLEINKGATALSNLVTEIGYEKFISIVLKWAASNQGEKVVFKSLYEILINHLSDESREQWVKVFETTESGLI